METVSHRGKVVQVTPESTTVEIISSSACSACHASGVCGMSEYTKKAVEVPTRAWENFTPGEEVNVVLKASMGHKAVWLAYVLPLLVLVAVLMGTLALGAGELTAGLGAIAGVALYYLFLWLFRDRLRNEYVFTIER
ncbi:MAG: SoxR reducing system RseC family protein [Bacteroidales bacterium]|nr:SoxR reducing system RseC family protein [Bacteroidales bacterium]MBR5072373.1 SoxR reducing system RseC family protein [Bacteroidales bacterium]